jgi:hypothetical protein
VPFLKLWCKSVRLKCVWLEKKKLKKQINKIKCVWLKLTEAYKNYMFYYPFYMKYLEKANQWRKKADLCSSGSRI